MKILITRRLLDSDIAYIRNGLDKFIKGEYSIVVPDDYSEESLLKYCEDVDVFLGPFVTKELLTKAKRLRLIQVPWTGMDTFDFEAVKGFEVPVCNTHTNADSVAEIGVALTLDLIKKISYHDRKMRNGNWNRDQQPLDLKSPLLSKQKVCVLGCGNIGYRISKLFKAFGASVECVDSVRKPDEVVTRVYRFDQMFDAVSNANIIVCCLPLTNETRECIGPSFYAATVNRPYIVNVSRAAIFNEEALYKALLEGTVSGFASDVWWNSPKRGETASFPSERNGFWKLDNVVMSPHRAGFIENCYPHLDGAIENIIALNNNVALVGIVDVTKGY